tara:strand:- start:85 stop:219 length:135 start_codon:yes stop_codon:yes gene_type:complete
MDQRKKLDTKTGKVGKVGKPSAWNYSETIQIPPNRGIEKTPEAQ